MSRPLRERLSGVGLLGAILLLAWSPAARAAQPDASELFGLDGQAPAEFRAKGSNGYTIEVEGSGRQVALAASGPAGTAVYVVPGRVSRRGISASFGSRGRVDVEFIPSRRRKVEAPPNRCKGKPRVTRWGVFAGTIRFAGERGYTRLRLRRAPGRTHRTPRWKCRRQQGGGSAGPQAGVPGESSEDSLVLEASNRRTGVEVAALASRPPGARGLTLFLAGFEERRGRMQIARFALASGGNASFAFDASLSTATISPPKPFAGTATFTRNPGGPGSLSGSLSVRLPGTARISLAGGEYRARLFRLDEDGIADPGTARGG